MLTHSARAGGPCHGSLCDAHDRSLTLIPAPIHRAHTYRTRARQVHASFYDRERLRPSRIGVDYLLPIFNNAIGQDVMEAVRLNLFHLGNLTQTYHSVNADINKRICYLD